MTQSPVVQEIPAAPVVPIPAAPVTEAAPAIRNPPRVAAEPRQTVLRAATRSASAAVAVPAVTTPPRVPAPAAVLPAATVPAAPVAAPLPEPAPLPATATQPTEDGLTGVEAGLLGLLAVAGLGGALIAARSRRRRLVEGEALEVAPMIAAVPEPESVPASPERFAMPAGPVPTGSERDELLKRMVAAPPDEANPFVSRKRRVHRARILLAERERELRDRSTEPFDWRTYRPTGVNAAQRAEAPGTVPNPT